MRFAELTDILRALPRLFWALGPEPWALAFVGPGPWALCLVGPQPCSSKLELRPQINIPHLAVGEQGLRVAGGEDAAVSQDVGAVADT